MRRVALFVLLAAARPAWSEPDMQERIRQAEASRVYTLTPGKFLLFDLPSTGDSLRLITHANLMGGARPRATDRFEYRIDLAFEGSDGTELDRYTHHFRTRMSEYTESAWPEPHAGSFYVDQPLLPLDARMVLLPLGRYRSRPEVLRVSWGEAGEGVLELGLRLQAREEVPTFKRRYRWQRMSAQERQKLARRNVFVPELLPEDEKQALLAQRWVPLAPRGLAGRDYQEREFYVLRQADGRLVEEPPLPEGQVTGPGRHGIVPLPEEGGRIRLLFLPVPADPARPVTGPTEIRWYGRSVRDRRSITVASTGGHFTVEEDLPGGLLEVVPPDRTVIRSFLQTSLDVTEITPAPWILKTYAVDPGQSIDFDLLHLDAGGVPVRLDVRTLIPAPGIAPPAMTPSYRLELRSEPDSLVESHERTVSTTPSMYDVMFDAEDGVRVTDPVPLQALIPGTVSRLRVVAKAHPLLVNLYNRPRDLTHRSRIPEDSFRFGEESRRQRVWFPLTPVERDRNRALLTQPRPPSDDVERRREAVEWIEHQPEGPWHGRILVVPLGGEIGTSPRTPVIPLEVGRELELGVPASPGRRRVTPRLLYATPCPPQTLDYSLDGRPPSAVRLMSTRGQVHLPPLSPGPHRLRLEASRATRFFGSPFEREGAPLHSARLAIRFDRNLEFAVEKQPGTKENISLRYFAPAGTLSRAEITVDLVEPGPRLPGLRDDWTLARRHYSLRPAGGVSYPVLEAAPLRVDGGQPFFFPMGEDIPPGSCRIRVQSTEPLPGYLLVSQGTTGVPEEREVYFEKALRD